MFLRGRINEFLAYQVCHPEYRDQDQGQGLKAGLRFDHVTFTYPDSGITAIDDLSSFTVEPGQKVAIIGRTAAGKSTIADLVLRMYDPTIRVSIMDRWYFRCKDYDLASPCGRASHTCRRMFSCFQIRLRPISSFGSQECFPRGGRAICAACGSL
jgi:ABC-type molybdenum transport system ATPase subunit/photorepair protein PhrA